MCFLFENIPTKGFLARLEIGHVENISRQVWEFIKKAKLKYGKQALNKNYKLNVSTKLQDNAQQAKKKIEYFNCTWTLMNVLILLLALLS
jgi:hypothetical protein